MNRRAAVLSKCVLVSPLLLSGAGAAWYLWPTSPVDGVTGVEVDLALREAGITPEALAAAGVNGAATTAVFQDAYAYLADTLAALNAADAAVVSARHDVETLERVVVAGGSTQEQRSALVTARTSLASATTTRATAVEGVFAAATAHLAQDRVSTLSAIRANAAQWNQPVQYLVLERSETDRVALREALAAVRIATDHGEEPDQSSATVVSTWNGEAAVAAAASGLQTNLGPVAAAWAEAVGP